MAPTQPRHDDIVTRRRFGGHPSTHAVKPIDAVSNPGQYSMNPSFLNLFRKKLTRNRVVRIISAGVACDTFGTMRIGLSCLP